MLKSPRKQILQTASTLKKLVLSIPSPLFYLLFFRSLWFFVFSSNNDKCVGSALVFTHNISNFFQIMDCNFKKVRTALQGNSRQDRKRVYPLKDQSGWSGFSQHPRSQRCCHRKASEGEESYSSPKVPSSWAPLLDT